jgi:hypothetical protein
VVVAVGAGFEAATYDQHGRLEFWADATGSWKRQSSLKYPGIAYDGGTTVSGAVLPGMSHATFVVNSPGFSGDGSGNAAVYAHGKSGWAIVVQQGKRLTPSQHPSASAQDIFFEAAAMSTGLRTETESDVFASAIAGSVTPVVDYWRWSDGGFTMAGGNTLSASIVSAPTNPAPPLPWGVPGTGTFDGVLQGVAFGPSLPGGVQEVVVLFVMPAILNAACLSADTCTIPKKNGYLPVLRFTLNGQAPMNYLAFVGTKPVRVTGPAWFLAMTDPYPGGNQLEPQNSPYSTWPVNPANTQGGIPSDYTKQGAAPWYIPPKLGLTSFALIEGYVQLTFSNGVLTRANIL